MPALFTRFKEIFDNMGLGIIACLVGGIMWMTELHLTTAASAEAIKTMAKDIEIIKLKIESDKRDTQRDLFEHLQIIDNRLSRIEGKLSK